METRLPDEEGGEEERLAEAEQEVDPFVGTYFDC